MNRLAELERVHRQRGDSYSSAEVIGLVGWAAAEIRRLQDAIEPFAEAAQKAETSGRPCFEFVGAADYEAAANAFKAT